ncbi:MAG: hypothetical protein AD742_01720 [Methylibium sp. NZG]|nr:MAG: hypothetical protein AD742_01720 [Methylibium sp. NZG]
MKASRPAARTAWGDGGVGEGICNDIRHGIGHDMGNGKGGNRGRARWVLRAVHLVLGALILASQAPAPAFSSPPRSGAAGALVVAGDLIVKFHDTSDGGATLASVLGGTRTLASAEPLATRLSEALGVPLKLVQVTSGREALLAIDRDALQRSLAQRAAREPGVARAVAVVPAAGLPSNALSVRLELTPQAAPQGLAAKLATPLTSSSLLQPRLHTDASGATLLSYDMTALTRALLERIKQQADVEYAQANRLLKPTGADKLR